MASAIDIINLALGHLGDEAGVSAITPPDGSAQAAHAQRFYPIARDAVVQMHNWGFAVGRDSLALLVTTQLPQEWAYAYAYPTCMKVIAVFPAEVASASQGAIFDQSEFVARAQAYPFTVEALDDGSQVIYSNVTDATVMFIRQVTDTAKFSPLVVMAISRLLASFLAGPLIKGTEGMKIAAKQLEWFEKVDGPRAKASDGQQGRNTSYDTFVPSGLKARS